MKKWRMSMFIIMPIMKLQKEKIGGDEMTFHEQDIVNNISISELLQNISARVFSLHEENRRLNKKKTKWHDLRKNPDDLPPIEIGCCTIDVLTDSGRFAYYHHDNNCWVDSNGVDEIDTPKAWCEIPKFEEGK